MGKEFTDSVKFICGGICVFALFFGVLGTGFSLVEGRSCKAYEAITKKETKHILWDSCYVRTDNGWQRWDEYLSRNTASDSLQ